MAGPRPVGVSIITIIIVIYGISAILAGIGLLLTIFGDLGTGQLIAAIVTLILGLIYLAVARGLWVGSPGARLIVAIITVIGLIAGIFGLFGGNVWLAVWEIVISIIILAVLYSGKAKAFFAA